ncbi:MAG TPA: bifunctional oligoribonuclease/PAP phosphatase NrnA [Bacillales bacterium]|nr:bifunctional oligoribonuclease/PAP phosphatase NrnA [Bacillales bacterium]
MKEQILNTIEQYETIIIHRHVRPDPDALGSQGGLAELLKTAFPDKKIYTVGEEEKTLMFLNQMDEIKDEIFEGALIIVCDTANAPRISDERYEKGDFLIKIDHHPNEDPYGDLIWVDPTASSVSEMIYEFYEYGKDRGLDLTDQAARLLYAGIVGDTGRFLFNNTTKKTFRTAGMLREYEFSIGDLYAELYQVRMNVMRLNGHVLQSFEMSSNGAGHIQLHGEILKKFQVSASDASQLVNAISDVEGIKAWVFFIEEPDQIRVRLRSKGPIVNEIAKRYGGGGHPMAAGATIYQWEEADQVLKDLEEACKA